MSSLLIDKILKRIQYPGLLDVLVNQLSGTELNSLLLEVFRERTASISAGELMKQYVLNRFVKPGDLPVIAAKQMELDLLKIFDGGSFEPVELSPVSVLGSCSVVGPASQHKVLSALRGTEVMADATNALALHFAHLKRENMWRPLDPNQIRRFSTIQRHVRTQMISGKGLTPHFKIACLVTCGYDSGSYNFEKSNMLDHISMMKHLYIGYYKVQHIKFRFICRHEEDGDPVALAQLIKHHVQKESPDTEIDIIEQPEKTNAYYKALQYKIDIIHNDETHEIGDGGFVDWTQQLLQNRKERMLSTGIGFEYMMRVLSGTL